MTEQEKIVFRKRLHEAKKHLPYRYGTIVRALHPELSFPSIYNVINKGTFNTDVLVALEQVARIQKKSEKKVKKALKVTT
jgi:hypothetical protein